MANSVKEKIITNLQKAKGESNTRAEHIREIVKDAVMQTLAELREGTDEIRVIVKDAVSTVIADLKGGDKEPAEKITASIEGALEGSTYKRQQVLNQQRAKLLEIQAQLDLEQEELDRESREILTDLKAAESADFIDDDSESIKLAINTVQERQESGMLQEQYLKLKSQLTSLDDKLESRYGDRYHEVKLQWENAKTWYSQKKAESESSGVIPLQQKMTDAESKVGDFGSVVANKEQAIKQQLQELWKNKGLGSRK